jgi:hypothetical protein
VHTADVCPAPPKWQERINISTNSKHFAATRPPFTYLTLLSKKKSVGLLRICEAFPVFKNDMDFDPITPIYGWPPRRGRRQNQTYSIPPSNQKNSNDGETLLESTKTQSSSIHLSRGINLNLLARISKFEALDALSMPIKLSSLRPAHLKISRNSVSLKGTETIHRKRLSTIFSPSSESRDEYAQLDDEFTSEQDTPASPKSRKWFFSKTTDSRKLRRSQASYRSPNIKMRGGVRETSETPETKGIDTVTITDVQKEAPSRRKTIRDMIKLYDGSSDKVVSKGNAHLKNLSLTNEAL